jgi:hypothetical protein
LVDAVARRVIELLQDSAPRPSAQLLTVSEIATRYRVRPSWVYAHKRELGVIRLGDGPKARLRFDAAVVASALPGVLEIRSSLAAPRPKRRRRHLRSRTPPPLS